MEKQKNNKMKLLVQKMQAYLDNFSKDNRKNNIDRTNYKERLGKLGFKHISEKLFRSLLEKHGYGDMSFVPDTENVGNTVTKTYENSLKQKKSQKQGEER